MKKNIYILFFLLLSSVGQAQINQIPDQTLLSTAIGTLHPIDSFLVSASKGGVSLFVYDSTTQEYRFIEREYIQSFDSLVTSKLADSVLIVNTHDEKLHFISLKNLPQLSYLGYVDLQRNFGDFTLIDNSLYIAGYFEGILRYDLLNYTQAQFVDSSMKGILLTQLDHDDQYLYALDEYNGILRYELVGFGFGTFVDYLFVPFRANAFTKTDSLFYLHLINGGLLVGDFNQLSGDNIVDSILDLNQVENLYYTDSFLVVTDNREITLINRMDYADKFIYPIQNMLPQGLINQYDTTLSLILPNQNGGMSFVTFDTSLVVRNGLEFNGNIIDILIDNSNLYLSSNAEPVQLFEIDSTGKTSYSYALYETLNNTGQMKHNGDSILVVYPELDKLAVIVNADDSDFAFLENSIAIFPIPPEEMHYTGEQIFDNALIFLEYPFGYDLFAVSDSGYLSSVAQWNFVSDMTSLSFKDSIAVITNRKNECEVYQILSTYKRSNGPIASFSLGGTASETIFHNDILYLFEDHEMSIIDFTDINNIFIDTVITIPFDVIDAVIAENFMFTVGYQGITKFDVTSLVPEVIETGGLPGNYICVDSNVIVIHDNKSVMLYYHELVLTPQFEVIENIDIGELAQNYPNPFNLETVINYSLSQKSNIEITVYNIIGQKVKTLINSKQDAGNHFVTWDGTNSAGNVIATGIYLYKLQTGNSVTTRKMILLK